MPLDEAAHTFLRACGYYHQHVPERTIRCGAGVKAAPAFDLYSCSDSYVTISVEGDAHFQPRNQKEHRT